MLTRGNMIRKLTCSLIIISMLILCFLPVASPVSHAITISDILQQFNDPNGPVHVVAHKGDWRSHPENSLPGIQSAIDMGVEMIEIDVRRTSDGVLILMHDETLHRMTNGTGRVDERTFSYIQSLYL